MDAAAEKLRMQSRREFGVRTLLARAEFRRSTLEAVDAVIGHDHHAIINPADAGQVL
jgi:hypothetical protein